MTGPLRMRRIARGAASAIEREDGRPDPLRFLARLGCGRGYQIIERSACVLAPRQSYGSTGIKSRMVTPTLKTASARAGTPIARKISDSARNLILRAPNG